MPRNSVMIFQEIQNRLKGLTLDIPQQNDPIMKTQRRSSLSGDFELDLKEIGSARKLAKAKAINGNFDSIKANNSNKLNALNNFGEIKEADEDLEESIISKSDELENCKKLLKEYSDLIKQMSEAMSLMDEEQLEFKEHIGVLEGNIEMYEKENENYKEEIQLKDDEIERILGLLEEKTLEADKAAEEKKEAVTSLQKFKKENEENEVIIIRENENIVEKNLEIEKELTELKRRLSSLNHVQSSTDLLNEKVEKSNRDLMERLEIFQNDKQVLEQQINLAKEEADLKIKELEINHLETKHDMENQIKEQINKIRELETESRQKDERIRELESREKYPTKEMSTVNRLNSYLETSQQLHLNEDSILKLDNNISHHNLLKGLDFSTNHGMIGIEEEALEDLAGEDQISVDEHLQQELELKTAELEARQKELESVRDNYQQEIHSLNKQFRELRRNTEFELNQVKSKLKYVRKKAAKNKTVYERKIDSLNKKVINLKIKTSEAIVNKDKLEMSLLRKLRLEQAKVAEYESMIKAHNHEAQVQNTKGFFRSFLNF